MIAADFFNGFIQESRGNSLENQWFPVGIPLHQSIDCSWLVVEPPLWKIWKSMGRIISSYMMDKIIQMFQTINQLALPGP